MPNIYEWFVYESRVPPRKWSESINYEVHLEYDSVLEASSINYGFTRAPNPSFRARFSRRITTLSPFSFPPFR